MVQKVILSANQFGINVKKVQKIVSNLSQIMTKKQTKELKDSTKSETFDDEELDYDDASFADMDLDYTTQY